MTTQALVHLTEDGLIRFSAILRHLRKNGENKLADQTVKEVNQIGRTCTKCGYLDDPIVAVEPVWKVLIIACPHCSGPGLKAEWEAQGEPS